MTGIPANPAAGAADPAAGASRPHAATADDPVTGR